MQLTNTDKFILFALGMWHEEANSKLKDKSLEVFISKAVFIEVLRRSNIVKKEERALYRNLELLESKKLVSYENKNISLTKKGYKLFNKVGNDIFPYVNVTKIILEKDPLSYSRRIQTRFSIK